MKTPSISGLVDRETATRSVPDEKMDQVRELLFGDFEKRTDERVAALEVHLREFEFGLHQRLDALQARLETLSDELDARQQTAQQEIAAGLEDLAARVRGIGGN
jgi:uncharacterized protein YPO0396